MRLLRYFNYKYVILYQRQQLIFLKYISLSLTKFDKENLTYNSLYFERTTRLLFNAKKKNSI